MNTSVLSGGLIAGTSRASTITVEDGWITGIDLAGGPGGRDVSGLIITPGLIDLQINGGLGDDFTSDLASIWRVGARLPEHGVTAFLPTIITSPPERIETALAELGNQPPGYRGAEPLGLHLEGPLISDQRPGIHDPDLIRAPASTPVAGWTRERGVLLVTLAPEVIGAEEAVKALLDEGVVVSAGHTAADYDQARDAFGWGVSLVTHLYNAMEPFEHRAPGLIGATFDSQDVTACLIVDGIHSHPSAVRVAWTLLGPHRLALVTDAMAATGLGDGTYQIASSSVLVSDGRPTDPAGRLAGSTLTLDQAVRNLIDFTGCSVEEATAAASTVPARMLGLGDRGRVEVGARADLTLFDHTMQVVGTMVGGEMVWQT
ncbi:MAG: N-acetylglucosamine-6-phosphate deacetylase [Acidimicrobiia bacterium]